MTPVDKALWFIESHSASALSLDDIAAGACVSRFHLLRGFSEATGYSVMRYLRGRRLSEAARRLAAGADDILALAVAAGYGSHEAFTRAFREQFGLTPETVRRQGHLRNLELLEPIRMEQSSPALHPPRFVDGPLLLLAGLAGRHNCAQNGAGIPAQWQRFAPHLGHIPGQLGAVSYGVAYNTDDSGNKDYLCAVQVSDFSALPPELTGLRVPAQRYAVFQHRGHVSSVRSSWIAVWNRWLPESGVEALDAPAFERYTEAFDPHTGNGGVELWLPLAPRR